MAPLKVGCWQWGANLHSCIFTHFPFPINPLVSLQKWQCAGNFYHYNLNMAEDESICEGLSFPSTFSLCQPCFSWSKTYPLYHGETGKNVQALIQSLKLLAFLVTFWPTLSRVITNWRYCWAFPMFVNQVLSLAEASSLHVALKMFTSVKTAECSQMLCRFQEMRRK